jgi:hypothetical protein
MSQDAFEDRLGEADGHLPEVISAAAERHGRPTWYRTPDRQTTEAGVDADFREGRTRAFDSMDDMFAEIDAVRVEDLL